VKKTWLNAAFALSFSPPPFFLDQEKRHALMLLLLFFPLSEVFFFSPFFSLRMKIEKLK